MQHAAGVDDVVGRVEDPRSCRRSASDGGGELVVGGAGDDAAAQPLDDVGVDHAAGRARREHVALGADHVVGRDRRCRRSSRAASTSETSTSAPALGQVRGEQRADRAHALDEHAHAVAGRCRARAARSPRCRGRRPRRSRARCEPEPPFSTLLQNTCSAGSAIDVHVALGRVHVRRARVQAAERRDEVAVAVQQLDPRLAVGQLRHREHGLPAAAWRRRRPRTCGSSRR